MPIIIPRLARPACLGCLGCLAFLWLLLVGGCATHLDRPILGRDSEPTTLAPFYHPNLPTKELPQTDMACQDYLHRPAEKQDSLVTAICHLNRDDWDSASGYARAFDSCSRAVVAYDIAVGKGLPKEKRFETLQSLVDCSEDSRFQEMIMGRSKLAHYE
jgi:hypothetical protein